MAFATWRTLRPAPILATRGGLRRVERDVVGSPGADLESPGRSRVAVARRDGRNSSSATHLRAPPHGARSLMVQARTRRPREAGAGRWRPFGRRLVAETDRLTSSTAPSHRQALTRRPRHQLGPTLDRIDEFSRKLLVPVAVGRVDVGAAAMEPVADRPVASS